MTIRTQAKTPGARKPRLSKFDRALADAARQVTREAVNMHHSAGRSVPGMTDGKSTTIAPPVTELL